MKYDLHGIQIAANVYTPANYDPAKKYPAIVVAHPNGALKSRSPVCMRSALLSMAILLLPPMQLIRGASGGVPRNVDKPANRIEDIHGMADFISQYPGVDSTRIGLLGICGGGGYSLAAAETDKRFKSIATISMFNSGLVRRNGMQDSQLDTIQQRLKQASDARAQEVAGSEVLYSGDANLTDEQIAKLPFALYPTQVSNSWSMVCHH